ncbi:MAG TPA: histidine--tRNA ligase [Spirochaetota bacterium]|nr:histidine--tRNA ligase [Spirochaetota bacterium]
MIEPRVLKGFRDYLPQTMIPKKEIIYKLEKTFESFGFVPIDTPALEYTEILLGKGSGETDKQIYRFLDHGKRDVALRFDLTVPLARFVSEHYNELIFPFKRYHVAPVWRGENTQKGRYREFYQCDFDILGSNSTNADLEILLVIKNGFDVINAGDYIININNRKILNLLLEKLGLQDKYMEILRIIDKIYKIGYGKVLEELTGVGIEIEKTKQLLSNLNLTESSNSFAIQGDDIFKFLSKLKNELGNDIKPINDLEFIFKSFERMDILKNFALNPAITRGLDYYTGIVFESFISDRMEFGSVCSGGRYDNLTGLYSKNPVSGVGASFGLDRLLALMEDKSLIKNSQTKTDILIFNLSDDIETNSFYMTLATYFRENGLNTEVVYEKQKIGNQFKLAEKKGINYIIIAGEEEIKEKKFNLKNILTGVEQKLLTKEEISIIVKGK